MRQAHGQGTITTLPEPLDVVHGQPVSFAATGHVTAVSVEDGATWPQDAARRRTVYTVHIDSLGSVNGLEMPAVPATAKVTEVLTRASYAKASILAALSVYAGVLLGQLI